MRILFVIALFAGLLYGQDDSIYTSYSGFYTGGQINSAKTSASYSGYLGIGYGLEGLNAGYDYLKIDSTGWNYTQKSYVVSPYYYFSSFYVKAAYMGITGDFNIDPAYTGGTKYTFSSDNTKVMSVELGNYGYYYSMGIGYTRTKLSGYKGIKVDQYTARYQFVPEYHWFFGVKPIYAKANDGRSYFSCNFRVNYLIIPYLIGKVSYTLGNRVYYFDNDLLTIFNQDQTQNKNFGIELDYYWGKSVIQAGWQYNEFEKEPTRYLILGFKYGTYISF